MSTRCHRWMALCCLAGVALSGCNWAPKSQLTSCQAHCRTLSEQNRAQLTEVANLKAHNKEITEQLAQLEDEMRGMYANGSTPRTRFSSYSSNSKLRDVLSGAGKASPVSLQELARKHPLLRYDSVTNSCQYSAEVLFDSGSVQLRPAAQSSLREFAGFLASPAGQGLNVLIVGHTDDRQVAKRETRDQFADNNHLSLGRAQSVQEYLERLGVSGKRLGVTGYGADQPLVDNRTSNDRQINRRVDLFVTPNTPPVVGRR